MSIATATATVSAAASSSLSAATADAAGHMKMKSLSLALPSCWIASFSHQNFNTAALAHFPSRRTCTRVICEVAISASPSSSSSSSSNDVSHSTSPDDAAAASSKIGARVRVKVPLKVHHVPRVPEVDITGLEGELKQYVGLWKGKRISANLPYKVQFIVDVEGRGAVKFFAHLKEDEFDYI